MSYSHKIDWCEQCERNVVLCGKCGNNTCNGGHGKVLDQNGDLIECDACESAYALDQELGLIDTDLDSDH